MYTSMRTPGSLRLIKLNRNIVPMTRTMASIHQAPPKDGTKVKKLERFKEFDLNGRVFAVTGGGRGLGLELAEALVEAGGEVHCLDRLEKPDDEFFAAKERSRPDFGGSLHYSRIDVRDTKHVDEVMQSIGNRRNRLDGMIAAAGVNHIEKAVKHTPEDIDKVMSINYTGVFTSATAAAKVMYKHKSRGSLVLVGSMSGLIANKGMTSPVYNSSKAAVIQLGRSLAMEWGKVDEEGCGGLRVNVLCPGHILTPMVEETFKECPGAKETWESENMMGRLSKPKEFRGAALFLLSDASSFMTGAHMLIDGGHTAW